MESKERNSFLETKLLKIEELPHTADVKYHVEGDNLNEAFELCGYCYGLTVTNLKKIEYIENVEFELNSEDLEGLLYDFMTELIFLFDTKGLIVSQFTNIQIRKKNSGFSIHVMGKGQKFDPSIHERKTEIKAMTYSEMEIDVDYADFKNPVSIIIVFDI